jgi:branched-subunit amino acid ABC-type transport system permease component
MESIRTAGVTIAVLVAILMVRPQGLFGTASR